MTVSLGEQFCFPRRRCAAVASFGGDAEAGALEAALEDVFYYDDPLRRTQRWAVQPTLGRPALLFAADAPRRGALVNDLPIGARVLTALAAGYRDNQLRLWADSYGPGFAPVRARVALKLDVPRPSWKRVLPAFLFGTSRPQLETWRPS